MEETDVLQSIPFAADANPPPRCVANASPAQLLGPQQRQALALQALSGTFTITALAASFRNANATKELRRRGVGVSGCFSGATLR